MSMTSRLYREGNTLLRCDCPSCGEEVIVGEWDDHETHEDGTVEYSVRCPECGQMFYASEDYD